MLSYDVSSIATKAIQVDGDLASDDPVWQEADARPSDTVHVTGRLSAAGSGRVYFSGHIEGSSLGECRRCLTDVQVPVTEDVHLIFVEEDDEEADDPDVYRMDPRAPKLDLRSAIREQWLLAAPAFVQCREDCKGLCPTCGADLNFGACECAPATDDRWAALRTPRDKHS